MRDAFGGVFMIKLFLVFIFIYVAFSAVSLNYAKAFRIKNNIIDYLEENEIIDLSQATAGLDQILDNAHYNKTCNNGNGYITNTVNQKAGYCYRGVVILKEQETKKNSSITYRYTVYTYADWNLGALNKILALGGRPQNSEAYVNGTWEITGEAKVVERIK